LRKKFDEEFYETRNYKDGETGTIQRTRKTENGEWGIFKVGDF